MSATGPFIRGKETLVEADYKSLRCHYPTLGADSGSRERRADIGEAPSHPLRHRSDYEPGYIEYLIDVTGEARVSCSSDGFRFCRRLLLLPTASASADGFCFCQGVPARQSISRRRRWPASLPRRKPRHLGRGND
jgi:hypothetical protein